MPSADSKAMQQEPNKPVNPYANQLLEQVRRERERAEQRYNHGLKFGLLGVPGLILFLSFFFNENIWCLIIGLSLVGLWQLLGGEKEA